MGIDYYSCEHCGESFPDCGEYVSCNDDCGMMWCDDECAKEDGYRTEDEEDEYGDPQHTCKYCRKEDATDYELVKFLLKHSGLSREEAVALVHENSSSEVKEEGE